MGIPEETITRLEKSILRKYTGTQRKLLENVLDLVKHYTDGTFRKNGDPAITHPLMVAYRVAEEGLGPNSVAAALLHDIIEDNETNHQIPEQIRAVSNDDVVNLVKALTVIRNNIAEQAAERNKALADILFLSLIKDLRVVIIKLSDVLHNLETLEGLSTRRQHTFTQEAERIYLPAAEYLGIKRLHKHIETEIFKHYHPKEYVEIHNYVTSQYAEGEVLIERLLKELSDAVSLSNSAASVEGRFKSIPSIYRKVKKYAQEGKPETITNLRDLLAFRIIAHTTEECYSILSTLTSVFSLKESGIRDYIAHPKPNGYQSIHVIAYDRGNHPFEVQIRTQEMHEYNESGPSSHLAYKKQGRRDATPSEEFLWIKTIGKVLNSYRPEDDKPIPVELFKESVFVLTPTNEFYQLPRGSTPLDFAYAIHTDLGNQCVGATINGKSVPLKTCLETGDVIEIQKNPKKKFPDPSWLEWVVTQKSEDAITKMLRRKAKTQKK